MLTSSIWGAIAPLISEFASRIDHDNGEGVEELFTADGVYAFEGRRLEGRAAIRDFYASRRAKGPRTARHLFVNILVTEVVGDIASVTSTLVLYAADGHPPLATPDAYLADYTDLCVKEGDQWLFKERVVKHIFGAVPSLAKEVPQT